MSISAQRRNQREASRLSKFWSFVPLGHESECWLWAGPLHKGYGRFCLGVGNERRWKFAHRFVYESRVGAIPEGLTLDHLCRVPRCVNPAHLEPVTASENTSRVGFRRSVCPNGHEYTSETRVRYGGRSVCRMCVREANKRARMRRKAVHFKVIAERKKAR